MSACAFCVIVRDAETVRKHVPTGFAWHGLPVVSFPPISPVTPGHRLFVPTRHVEDAAHRPDVAAKVFRAAALWAQEHPGDFNLITSAGAAATQTVFHLHVHYVPRYVTDGLKLPWTD